MDRISDSLCSVLHHILSFPCAQIDLAAFGGADVGRCLRRRLRPVSLLPEPFLSPCWKLLLPALAPGWGVGWQDSLGRAKAMEGWDGRGSSSTGAPCWGEASSRVTSCGVTQMGSSAPMWSRLDPCLGQGHHGGGWPRAS